MAFTTLKAISVGDQHFNDRSSFEYLGVLDDISEDGILLSRAPDSIIFNHDINLNSTDPHSDLSSVAQSKLSQPSDVVALMAQSEDVIVEPPSLKPSSSLPSTSTQDQPSIESDEDVFVPNPTLMQALSAGGYDEHIISDIEKISREVLETLSFNRALFSIRDFENLLAKQGNPSWIKHPSWNSVKPLLFETLGLCNLTPELEFTPNAMLSLQTFLELENEMIQLAKRETDAHSIPQELVDSVLASKPTMAEEQRIAAVASCSGTKAVVVTEGTAGAGKSFTLNAIREVYENIPPANPGEEPGYDIIGTALSWTATKVLEESAGLSGGRAIQGLTMAMEEARESGGDFFKRRTILIVDEAGLVGVKHMHKILWHSANSRHPVRVLLTGDSLQLCPVEAGNALEAIVDECGSSRLDTIRRQKQASHRAAVKHFCYGRAEQGLWTFWQQEAIHFSANADERRELVMRDYVRYCVSNPQDIALVLALENAEVKTLNSEIRERLKLVGRLLGDEHEMTVTDGRGAYKAKFCVGDQIVLRKNKVDHPVFESAFEKIFHGAAAAHRAGEEQATSGFFSRIIRQWQQQKKQKGAEPPKEIRQGIFNRTVGIIIDIKKNPEDPKSLLIRCLLNEGGEVELDTSKYFDEKANAIPLHHNFATTIYASQGQTVQKVLIMDSPYMNRRLAYVGMSRHTMMCDIYADCAEIEARVAKDGAKKIDRAWKKFEKDVQLGQGHDHLRIAKLKEVISQWTPSSLDQPKASEYLKAMANAWNTDSANPTVFIAKKQMNKKKKSIIDGVDLGMPTLCLDDDPEDHLDPRLPEPYLFENLQMGAQHAKPAPKSFLSSLASKKKNGHEIDPSKEILTPLILQDDRESKDLPEWAHTEPAKSAIEAGLGKFWNYNRYGYPRFFSLSHQGSYATSRWSFEGALKAGDAEPSVLVNEIYKDLAPWMIVPGPKEAILSYGHYRKLHEKTPEKIPNIVAAPPACDLNALSLWVKPGSVVLHCTWSTKNPETLARAQEIAKTLHQLGHTAKIYPPAPQPTTSTMKKHGT